MIKKQMGVGKFIIASAIVVAMTVMGTSYATWSDKLNTFGKFSTDRFAFAFGNSGYIADLVDAAGNSTKLLDFTVNILDGGKGAELLFRGGIPNQLLMEGNYIRISYPIQNPDLESKMNIYTYEPDFTKAEKEEIIFESDQTFLSIGSTVYEYQNIPAEYKENLKFNVYRSVHIENEEYYGNLFLELSNESKEYILHLPVEITLEKEELEMLLPTEFTSEQDGIMVNYHGNIEFFIEQHNKEAQE